MNITLHRTLMVCMLAGALALTIALVAAKDVSAAPSPARLVEPRRYRGTPILTTLTLRLLPVPLFWDTIMPSSCMGTWKVVCIQTSRPQKAHPAGPTERREPNSSLARRGG